MSRPISTGRGAFGAWLSHKMKTKHVNRLTLSEFLEVHYQTITKHITGRSRPSNHMILAYCAYFNCVNEFAFAVKLRNADYNKTKEKE